MTVRRNIKILIALIIAMFFFYLTLKDVDIGQMVISIKHAKLSFILLSFFALFANLCLRAIRWKIFLQPLDKVSTKDSLIALIIGYAGNIIFPAYLGELLRIQSIRRKNNIRIPSALATIAVDRFLDVLCLLILFFIAIQYFIFPKWIYHSGKALTFILIFAIFLSLIIAIYSGKAAKLFQKLSNHLPDKIAEKVKTFIKLFLEGLDFLKNWQANLSTLFLSIIIWITHLLAFMFAFNAFDLRLGWSASITTLVITTLSVLIPLTPGYIGSFHFLCQLSLGMFGISKNVSTAFAFVFHAISTFPFLAIGIILFLVEGINLKEKSYDQIAMKN